VRVYSAWPNFGFRWVVYPKTPLGGLNHNPSVQTPDLPHICAREVAALTRWYNSAWCNISFRQVIYTKHWQGQKFLHLKVECNHLSVYDSNVNRCCLGMGIIICGNFWSHQTRKCKVFVPYNFSIPYNIWQIGKCKLLQHSMIHTLFIWWPLKEFSNYRNCSSIKVK
jgi:hypothetical protein